MALETLRGIKKIDGFDVIVMDDLKEQYPEKFNKSGAMISEWFEKEIRPKNFIYLRHDVGSISFKIQSDTVSKVGIDGCQMTAMIVAARIIIEKLNAKFPCPENEKTIEHLNYALSWQERRTKDREARNVEGYNKA